MTDNPQFRIYKIDPGYPAVSQTTYADANENMRLVSRYIRFMISVAREHSGLFSISFRIVRTYERSMLLRKDAHIDDMFLLREYANDDQFKTTACLIRISWWIGQEYIERSIYVPAGIKLDIVGGN